MLVGCTPRSDALACDELVLVSSLRASDIGAPSIDPPDSPAPLARSACAHAFVRCIGSAVDAGGAAPSIDGTPSSRASGVGAVFIAADESDRWHATHASVGTPGLGGGGTVGGIHGAPDVTCVTV